MAREMSRILDDADADDCELPAEDDESDAPERRRRHARQWRPLLRSFGIAVPDVSRTDD